MNMIENKEIELTKKESQETYEKYNLLINYLFCECDRELSRKGRLDAKVMGYFSIFGIFFAAFLVIEPKLIETFKKIIICPCLQVFNLLLVIAYFVIFCSSFLSLKGMYKPKEREKPQVLQKWDDLLKEKYGNICESIKKPLFELCETLFTNNESIAEKLNEIQQYFMIQGIIIIVLFLIYFIINYIKIWR